MDNTITISGRGVGENQPVFVIAELGINHNGIFSTAKQLIDKAKWAGASAVKLQTYITEKRVAKDSPLFGILKQCELTFEQQKELFEYAREQDIDIFSTPFDDESVDFLKSINVSCYKIASFDLVNKKLLKKVASQNKPIIMSRGMAKQHEIDTAVEIIREDKTELALLHCISAYPVPDHTSLNLKTIRALAERYHCPVGFSDHTIGIKAPQYAVALGASIIEKHFTLSRKSEGPDHAISTEPEEMREMISGIQHAREMMGEPIWEPVPVEKEILQYRRIT